LVDFILFYEAKITNKLHLLGRKWIFLPVLSKTNGFNIQIGKCVGDVKNSQITIFE
jgi:hypothetical protein